MDDEEEDNQDLDRMEADEEEYIPDPDRCPACCKKYKNVLLHIKKTPACYSEVGSELYNSVKISRNKKKKRKYQDKYRQSGKHNVAQAKYDKKFRLFCEVCPKVCSCCGLSLKTCRCSFRTQGTRKEQERYRRKPFKEVASECSCPKGDRRSFLEIKRQNWSKYQNKMRVVWDREIGNQRLESFKKLCYWCLWYLKKGRIENSQYFNRFHLVECDFIEIKEEKYHGWLKEIDSTLFKLVKTFQDIVMIPTSRWIWAIEEVNAKENKRHLQGKLYKLIGKLQSYGNKNTLDIVIPEEFKFTRNPDDQDFSLPERETLSKEAEMILVEKLQNIVGDEEVDEELQVHLRLKVEKLKIALEYTVK